MALDFSELDAITYRGARSEKERQDRDKTLSEGYTVVDVKTPFEAPQTASGAAEPAPLGNPPAKTQNASGGPLRPFLSHTGRHYRTMYREACNFHERHNDRVEDTVEYWRSVAEDMEAVCTRCNNDSFLQALLLAILGELESEAKIKGVPPPRGPRKAGTEIRVCCTETQEAIKLKPLMEAGEVELLEKVAIVADRREAHLHYKLLKDEDKLSSPLPAGIQETL